MPLSIIKVGVEFYLTGRLQVASDGSKGTGKYFQNYPVRIVRTNGYNPYPILLGDDYSDQLGWVNEDMLTSDIYITTVYISG